MAKRPRQLGMAALPRVHRLAPKRAAPMMGLRPTASEMGPVKTNPKARTAVDVESTRLLCAAVTPKALESMGIIGCTQ